MPQDGEKEILVPKFFDDRQTVRATAASLRRALADRNLPITFGGPDVAYDGRFREDKFAGDFLKPDQFRHFAWMLRWRGQVVSIETAPSKRCQTNPDQFGGLKKFENVEDYLHHLDNLTDWAPRDGWGLAGMWRELARLIPESAGAKIAHLYPDRRSPDDIAADTAAEHTEAVEPVVEPIVEPAAETITTPVQVTPPRTLAPEASRYLETGFHD